MTLITSRLEVLVGARFAPAELAQALARAELGAAMDPALVAAPELAADRASLHFLVKEPVA